MRLACLAAHGGAAAWLEAPGLLAGACGHKEAERS